MSTPSKSRTLKTDGGKQPHVLDYLRLLSKRRWTAAPVFVAVVAAVAAYSWIVTPLYEARGQIMLDTERPRLIIFNDAIEQGTDSIDYQQTQHRILQSRGLARRTIETLDIWTVPELTGEKDGESPRGFANRVSAAVGGLMERFSKSLPTVGPMEARGADESAQQAVVIDRFLDRVTVAPIRNTRLVDVKFRSADPELAARVTNALAQAYIDQNLDFKNQSAKEASDWLTAQLGEQRRQVEQSEAKLQQYRERTVSVTTNERENLGLQKLAELNSSLTRARMERIQREASLQQLVSIEHDASLLERWPVVNVVPAVQLAKSDLDQARRLYQQLRETLGDKHPDMRAAVDAVSVAEAKYQGEVAKVVAGIRNDFAAALQLETSLASAVEGQKQEALAIRGKEIEYDALERDAVSDRQIFESLLQRTKEANVSGEIPANNIRIVDAADVPRAPVSPRKDRNLLIGILAGGLFAVGVAFTREYFDKAIKTPTQIKEQLGLPCIGLIPLVGTQKSTASGPLLNGAVPPHFTEAFRTIRTNVLFASDGEDSRTILITSTGPHEGKTIVACNLAVALAQAGQQVLLIDADMRRPRVNQLFGLSLENGLAELTASDGDPETYVRKSTVPNLSVMTAGALPPNPHELLSSPQFGRALTMLTRRYQWVLIDTPPIMPVSDAALVAHTEAGVLFVIGADRTTIPSALNALEQLEAANARFVGAVLNMAQLDRHKFFYADHYRAEYGEYYKSTTVPATSQARVAKQH